MRPSADLYQHIRLLSQHSSLHRSTVPRIAFRLLQQRHTHNSNQHCQNKFHNKQGLGSLSKHSGHKRRTVYASYTPFIVLLTIACTGVIVVDSFNRDKTYGIPSHEDPPVAVYPASTNESDPFYTDMPIAPGHLGNLTPEQEAKLQRLWNKTLKVFGVDDPSQPAGSSSLEVPRDDSPSVSDVDTKDKKRKKSRLSLFGKKHDDTSDTSSPTGDPSRNSADDDDKYGQVKEFQQIVSTQTPESLRTAFWSMVKADHPDALLLRFLRARKWDVDKALVMMISTMSWRGTEIHVDDDIVYHGELGALIDSQSGDATAKSEGHDFLQQLRMGKSFLHGTDKEGRPLCFVRARLHRAGDQSERSMERYTVYVIETARLALRTPIETACIVFDMSHFTMANMDYTPVKFMIKIFEANYPESLGAILVHKSPWLFQGVWKIIKGWLDPVVAGKVHFTSNVEELQEYIPKSQIIKELGGDEDWEYKYIEPISGEDDLMKDTTSKKKLQDERNADVVNYQKKTFEWIAAGSGDTSARIKDDRDNIARTLNDNYWRLDPYVRARSLYDRVGMIEPGGKINFFPSNKTQGLHAPALAGRTNADDVD